MNSSSNFICKENILIVDDNPANLSLLNEMLSQQGYKVRAALSGKIALKSVQIAPPDLILLDILMPEMDGYEVCQALKVNPITKEIPVIFISALNEVFDKIKAFSLGGSDYIPKPFRTEEVLARIQNQLRINRLSKELSQQNNYLQQELLERQKAEQALRENQSLLKGIIEGTTDQIAALNLEFKYIAFNNAYYNEFLKIFGKNISVGSSLIDVLADQPEVQEKMINLWKRALSGEEFSLIQEFGNSDRDRSYYEITYSTIQDFTGKQIGASHIIKNVTDRIQAEQALRQSEERYRALVTATSEAVWINSSPENFHTTNSYWLNLTGQTETNLQTGEWIEAIHPEDRERVLQTWKAALANQTMYEVEYRLKTADNQERDILARGVPIYAETGQVREWIGTYNDITEKRALERQLAQQKDLLDAFFRSSHFGMCAIDEQRRYFLVNEALAEINGFSVADHIGKTPQDIVPNLASKQEAAFQQVFATGQPVPQLELSGETQKLPGVTRTWLTSYFPIHNQKHQPIGIGIVMVEITQRIAAEVALRESEARFQLFMNNSPLLAWIVSGDGTLFYCNRSFEVWNGRSNKEIVGKTIFDIYPPEVAQNLFENNQEVLRTATLLECYESVYSQDNIKHDFLVYKFPLPQENGQFLIGGTAIDITQQKQAEEQIKSSLVEKEVLLKEIHHRVKNNLQIVKSLLHIQSRRTQQEEALLVLQDSQNRIASIALVHEKIYRSADLAKVDFAQYVPSLATHLFHTYNVNSNNIKLKLETENIFLQIDTAIPCGLIINELVSNSLKYAFPNNRPGQITVRFNTQEQGKMLLTVEDDGVGISEDFDIEKSLSSGLKLVQALVKQLKGKIEIDRTQGTKFIITFVLRSN